MEIGLMIFALVMAGLAAIVVVACVVTEASEAWDIRRFGWGRGHHATHLPHRPH